MKRAAIFISAFLGACGSSDDHDQQAAAITMSRAGNIATVLDLMAINGLAKVPVMIGEPIPHEVLLKSIEDSELDLPELLQKNFLNSSRDGWGGSFIIIEQTSSGKLRMTGCPFGIRSFGPNGNDDGGEDDDLDFCINGVSSSDIPKATDGVGPEWHGIKRIFGGSGVKDGAKTTTSCALRLRFRKPGHEDQP